MGASLASVSRYRVTVTSSPVSPVVKEGRKVKAVSLTEGVGRAWNMDLSTYKNVAITGWFDAEDGEGDSLTFQLTSTPVSYTHLDVYKRQRWESAAR